MDKPKLSALAAKFSTVHEIEIDGETRYAIPFPDQLRERFSDQAMSKVLEGTPLEGKLEEAKQKIMALDEKAPHPTINTPGVRETSHPIPHRKIFAVRKTRSRMLSLANTTLRGCTYLHYMLASVSLLLEGKPRAVIHPQISSFEEVSVINLTKIYDTHDDAFHLTKMLNHAEQNPDYYTYADDDVVRTQAREDRTKLESNTPIQTSLSKIRDLRHGHLAHNDPTEPEIRKKVDQLDIALSEICLLYELAENIVDKYLLYATGEPLDLDTETEAVEDYYNALKQLENPTQTLDSTEPTQSSGGS